MKKLHLLNAVAVAFALCSCQGLAENSPEPKETVPAITIDMPAEASYGETLTAVVEVVDEAELAKVELSMNVDGTIHTVNTPSAGGSYVLNVEFPYVAGLSTATYTLKVEALNVNGGKASMNQSVRMRYPQVPVLSMAIDGGQALEMAAGDASGDFSIVANLVAGTMARFVSGDLSWGSAGGNVAFGAAGPIDLGISEEGEWTIRFNVFSMEFSATMTPKDNPDEPDEPVEPENPEEDIPDTDPDGAVDLALGSFTDTDTEASIYYGTFIGSNLENGTVFKIDESISLDGVYVDKNFAKRVGPHTIQVIAPTGKYGIVLKPAAKVLYAFRVKGGGDYDGWTASEGGGSDSNARGKRNMFIFGQGIGVCDLFAANAAWNLKCPVTVNGKGKTDGYDQPVYLNLSTTDYTEGAENVYTAIVKFASVAAPEFTVCGSAKAVWPVEVTSTSFDSSLTVESGSKEALGEFALTATTYKVKSADYDALYKVSVIVNGTSTRTIQVDAADKEIGVINASLSIEKL